MTESATTLVIQREPTTMRRRAQWPDSPPVLGEARSPFADLRREGSPGVVLRLIEPLSESLEPLEAVLDKAAKAVLVELTVTIKDGQRRNAGIRSPIPERVRREVWRRDGGRCVDCGSRERLEYDHIIPLSKGGANTQSENLELRCETCNRRKAASI